MRRIGVGAACLVTLAVIGGLFSGWMGWLSMPEALDVIMGIIALAGLWLVVWLPWDLYFAARAVAVDQEDSLERGVAITERDRTIARRLAPRLLLGCLALHLIGGGVITLVTYFSAGRVGYYFAGFYLLAMGLRPLGALYTHLRARLHELSARARYPREDVVSLRMRVDMLEQTLLRIERSDLVSLGERDQKLDDAIHHQDDEARRREGRYDAKVDRVLSELERSMAKLTEDRELLAGIRAFVRVIKQS